MPITFDLPHTCFSSLSDWPDHFPDVESPVITCPSLSVLPVSCGPRYQSPYHELDTNSGKQLQKSYSGVKLRSNTKWEIL